MKIKSIILALTLLLFIGSVASAQDSLALGSRFTLHYSSASPVGKFNSSDFENDFPPFAAIGHLVQLGYAKSIGKHWQTGVTLAWRLNAFDMDKFADKDDELVTGKESTPWQSLFTLADVQYRLPARNGSFYVKGSVGAAFNRSTSLRVDTPYGTINRASVNKAALAYGLHAGLQADLKQFGFGLETGLLSTSPTFKITDQQGKQSNYKQPMTTVNMGVFAAYSF